MVKDHAQGPQAERHAEREAGREAGRQDALMQHTLPGWVLWVQEHLMLSFLIIAEAYILGTLMTLGWVKNIEDPASWGWFAGIGVVLFFLAGITAAGVALRCSVTAAAAFARRSWGFGLFNLVGLFVFTGAEIWASLSERSTNLQPTPADKSVLLLLAQLHDLAISPTALIVAVLLPFATFFWGFSQAPAAPQESGEQRALRQQKEQEELAHKLKMQQMRAGGIAATIRSAGTALMTRAAEDTTQENTSANDETAGETTGSAVPGQDDDDTSRNSRGKSARFTPGNPPGNKRSGSRNGSGLRAVPTGQWTRTDLQRYAQAKYDQLVGDEAATRVINTLGNGTRLDGLVGQPYAAPRASVKAWVDKQYSGQFGGQFNEHYSAGKLSALAGEDAV